MPLVAPSISLHSQSYATPSTSVRHLQSPSTTLNDSCSPKLPPGLLSQHSGFSTTPRVFPSLLGCIPSCSAPSTTVPRSESPSMSLNASWSSICPPGALSGLGAFFLSMRSFLMLLGRSGSFWRPSGMAVSPPGSSGSSPGLLGEFCRLLCLEHLRSRSDMFGSFFGRFQTSSTLPDVVDTSALSSGSSDST